MKKKAQLNANEVIHLQDQASHAKRQEVQEVSHLHQQASRACFKHDNSANEAAHLQQVTYQHQNNRVIENERLDNHDEIENIGEYGNEFKLRNPQLSMQEAINFLNLNDPLQHKWSDFEKSPVKSLLLCMPMQGALPLMNTRNTAWHSMVSKWMSKNLKRKLPMKCYQMKSLEI